MTTTNVRAVDHVQLPIPLGTMRRARDFYEDALGLREVRDPALDRPGTLRFSLGWQRLDLHEGPYTGVAPQAHLALQVLDLRGLVTRLREGGFAVDDAHLSHLGRLYVEDPFGNRLELIEFKQGSPAGVSTLRLAI
ncbi:MAG TPA: VOC family protein [Burkholderiaceae bacterium]|jgi:catechol 2,3-dioxygenase-like lactoylglutathione lyase family enzyme|nr:VOC family protein [Burkholderiaceae bacterium]